jgi:hypothetical protein
MARPTAVPRSSTSTPAPPARRSTDLKASVLSWEEPPLSHVGGKGRPAWYAGHLGELRTNPRRWAKVLICPSKSAAAGRANTYRSGLKRKTAPRGYEFVSRGLPDGRGAVYGRYVGKDEE